LATSAASADERPRSSAGLVGREAHQVLAAGHHAIELLPDALDHAGALDLAGAVGALAAEVAQLAADEAGIEHAFAARVL
jgi:hypothetical protein